MNAFCFFTDMFGHQKVISTRLFTSLKFVPDYDSTMSKRLFKHHAKFNFFKYTFLSSSDEIIFH